MLALLGLLRTCSAVLLRAGELLEIQRAPHRGLRKKVLLRKRIEGKLNHIRFMPSRFEMLNKGRDKDLLPAVCEGNLRSEYENTRHS
jgi:hypothetical protein